MKKFLLTVLVVVFVGQMTYAQTSDAVTLRLRNGVAVTGQILEENSNSIKIKTSEGDVFIYRANEVSRIDGRDVPEVETSQKTKKTIGSYGNFKGYRSFVDITTAVDTSAIDMRFGVSYVGGYNFNSYFFAGVGVGLMLDELMCDVAVHVPISLNLRSAFLKGRKVSPFVSMSGGYNLAVLEGYYGSCGFVEPTIGAEIRTRKKAAFSVGLTVPVMINRPCYYGWYGWDETAIYVGLKLGVSF